MTTSNNYGVVDETDLLYAYLFHQSRNENYVLHNFYC